MSRASTDPRERRTTRPKRGDTTAFGRMSSIGCVLPASFCNYAIRTM